MINKGQPGYCYMFRNEPDGTCGQFKSKDKDEQKQAMGIIIGAIIKTKKGQLDAEQ
jgi:hypothetical protein